MKNNIKHYLFLLFISLIIPSFISAQKDYKWDKKDTSLSDLPAEYANEDAVILYDYETRKTTLENNNFYTRHIIKRRVKILTKKGLDEFGKIVIAKQDDMQVSILDARTFKQNGEVVDLDASSIKSLDINEDEDIFDSNRYKLFSVPGLEVGDEFEMVCVFEGKTIEQGENILMHRYLPVIDSKFELDVYNKIIVFTSVYNNMPKPTVNESLSSYIFSWNLKNLPGLYDERGTISASVLPFFIYELNLTRFYSSSAPPKIDNWEDLLNHINDSALDVVVRKRKKLDAILDAIIGDKATASKLEQLQQVHQHINENVQIKSIPDNIASNGIEYFYENNTADFHYLLKMYKALFEKVGVEYYLASGRSRYLGDIRLDFPTSIQITEYLFVVNIDGDYHLFVPKEKKKYYEMDEVPPELENTSLYMINMTKKDDFKHIKIPASTYKKNRRLRQIKSSVKLDDQAIAHNCKETLSGAISTDIRHYYIHANKNDALQEAVEGLLSHRIPNAKLESAKISKPSIKPPFDFELNYDFTTPNVVVKVDESVYKISIENWLTHNVYNVNPTNRLLDYFPPYAGLDNYSYVLEFDKEISLANKENIDVKIKNDMGSYELSINQVKPNTIILRSKYQINTNHIPVNQVKQLAEINEGAKKADGVEIMINILE